MMVTIWKTKKVCKAQQRYLHSVRELVIPALAFNLELLVLKGFHPVRYQMVRDSLRGLGTLSFEEEHHIFNSARRALRCKRNVRESGL